MKSIKELRKNNKKGFTLVELIVVLVILAILAALLIPTLTGYIDKAKEKDVIAQTRQAVMAAQTLVDEAYAKKDDNTVVTVATDGTVKLSAVETLAELKTGSVTSVTLGRTVDGKKVDTEKVTELIYTNKGKTCTYKSNPTGTEENYNVVKATD